MKGKLRHPEGAKRPRDLLRGYRAPVEKIPRCARDDVPLASPVHPSPHPSLHTSLPSDNSRRAAPPGAPPRCRARRPEDPRRSASGSPGCRSRPHAASGRPRETRRSSAAGPIAPCPVGVPSRSPRCRSTCRTPVELEAGGRARHAGRPGVGPPPVGRVAGDRERRRRPRPRARRPVAGRPRRAAPRRLAPWRRCASRRRRPGGDRSP